jgi:glycosyltransferase involved in cell wall biosynthesis
MNHVIYFEQDYLPKYFEDNLLSIMMPIFNGERFLTDAIESLLNQTYKNIEIIILDNISTDKTAEICKNFIEKDKRIKYVLDSKRRNPHDAANKLSEYITGEFCMLACDDDVWESTFAEKLISVLKENESLSLAYSNAKYIDIDGIKGEKLILPRRAIITSKQNKIKSIGYYLFSRRVVPIIFGIYRSKKYISALPFRTFDDTIADVDNLFIINILINGNVQYKNEALFFYRNKYRWTDKNIVTYANTFISEYLNIIKHQYYVMLLFKNVINKNENNLENLIIKLLLLLSFIYYIGINRLRGFIGRILHLKDGPARKMDIVAEERSMALLIIKNNQEKINK